MTAGAIQPVAMDDGAEIGVYRVGAGGVRGTLVLLQEIFGLTEHIRETCDGFAAEGFEVIAPALFDREEPGLQASYDPDDVAHCITIARDRHPFERTVSDVAATILLARPDRPVFILGYCYGGSAACRIEGLAAAVSYYGSHVIRMVDEVPRCPTMLHFGERDAGIPPTDVAAMRARHRYLPVHVYDAGHGFNSDRRADFDAPSANLARRRSLAFFTACGH